MAGLAEAVTNAVDWSVVEYWGGPGGWRSPTERNRHRTAEWRGRTGKGWFSVRHVEDEADTMGGGAALDEGNGLCRERGHAGREVGGGGLAGGRAEEGKFFICSFLT